MKKLLVLLLPFFVSAKVHFSRLEPVSTYTIKSSVSGIVTIAKEQLEAKVANTLVIKIDDKLDKIDLANAKESIKILEDMIAINKKLLPALEKNLQKKYQLYKKLLPVAASSQNQKDSLYNAFINAKVQLSSTREKIKNFQSQILNLKKTQEHLKDIIRKKNITVKNKYIYKIYPKVGEFVTVGTPLLKLNDISKAKLTLFLSEDEIKDINKKKIYINGKETNLKFNKIWKVADEEFISSYKAEIVLKPITNFSKLVKVEIK
jgi:multidrug resistance efflux pump